MPIDKSIMKRLAVQICSDINPESVSPLNNAGDYYTMTPKELLAFAQACYAMGAEEQKVKDAKLCEEIPTPRTRIELADSIRNQK